VSKIFVPQNWAHQSASHNGPHYGIVLYHTALYDTVLRILQYIWSAVFVAVTKGQSLRSSQLIFSHNSLIRKRSSATVFTTFFFHTTFFFAGQTMSKKVVSSHNLFVRDRLLSQLFLIGTGLCVTRVTACLFNAYCTSLPTIFHRIP
jgi:hypothetical protein